MPNSKIKPEDTPKAKEILLKIEESKILVKKITTEALQVRLCFEQFHRRKSYQAQAFCV